MDAQGQRGRRRFLWKRWLIIGIVLLVVVAGGVFWIFDSRGEWLTILPVVLFTALGIIVALFQWLFPVSSDPHEQKVIHAAAQAGSPTSLVSPTGPSLSPQPIFVHIPHPVSGELPPVNKTVYRSIAGVPPLTDPRTIQQRQKAVEEICAQLLRDDVTAIVLTGIGGVGKSTLAALVYRAMEEQRRSGKGSFGAQALWLKVDSSAVTMIDLVCTIFEGLGKPLPDVSNLAPHNQAATLFNALNDVGSSEDEEAGEGARLIVLDQFENLLDWQTGAALPDQPGIGEWLDIINGQPCRCRILLTSRPWPQGTRNYPSTYMQEYHVHGLDEAEGVELLRKLRIDGSEGELLDAVTRCGGHAYALTLLAALLRNRNLSLSTFFKVPIYAHVWTGNVARNLLDYIVVEQLDATQRNLLLAFAVFREPVPLEAASAVADLDERITTTQKQQALDTLLAQHLLQPGGEDCYQLHAIVGRYALDHFDSSSEQANQQALMIAHGRAAQYYRQYVAQHMPPRDQRLNLDEVRPLVESIWHRCQSGEWGEAYRMLFLQDRVYADLHRWGHNVLLLDVFEDFMSLYKQQAASVRVALPYNLLGKVYRSLGRYDEARVCYEQALDIARRTGDRAEEGWTYNNLGRVYADEGKGKEAQQLYQQGLALLRETKTLMGEGIVLDNLGWLSYDLGQMDQARAYYQEALELRKTMKDRRGVGSVLNSLGRVSANLGKLEEALQLHEEALAISREVKDRNGEAWALHNLGRIYTQQRKGERARSYFEEALAIRRETGNRRNEAATLSNLGHLLYEMGDKEAALEYYRQALPLRREVGNRSGEGKTLQYLGQSYADLGQYEQAFACFCSALRIRRALGHLRRELRTLNSLGLCALALQRTELALACFLLANDYANDPGSFSRDQHWIGKDYGPLVEATQHNLELLQSTLGEQAFAALLVQVGASSAEIVEHALQATGDAS